MGGVKLSYKRILVKLSGSALADEQGNSFGVNNLEHITNELLSLVETGVQVAVVIGGGNIFRGNLSVEWGIDRVEADNIGTLGTIINSLMLRGVLKNKTDREIRVMTAVPAPSVAEPFIRLKAIHHLEKGYLVIFGGGNGQPFVTTDYPSVQRAIELHCDALFVAKRGVNGVFTADPAVESNAKMYHYLAYDDVVKNNIKVMDQSALLLARDFNLPVHIFNFNQAGVMAKICAGEHIGTKISNQQTQL
jgi:uridylate kinase